MTEIQKLERELDGWVARYQDLEDVTEKSMGLWDRLLELCKDPFTPQSVMVLQTLLDEARKLVRENSKDALESSDKPPL